MTKVIVYTRPDGGISVCYPLISQDDPRSFTIEDAIARALSKDVPDTALEVQVIDAAELPADRTFRQAWRQSDGRVSIDITKARAIQLARLRGERNAKLVSTDGLFARALERGDAAEQTRLAAYREELRQMPTDIAALLSAAKTPEEIKAVRPSVLER